MTATRSVRPDTIPCVGAKCGVAIPVPSRGPIPRHCPACKRRHNLDVRREREQAVRDAGAELLAYVESLRPYLTPAEWMRAEDFLAHFDLSQPDAVVPLVPDRMPDGSMSPAGSDDGTTTSRSDLQGDLDRRRVEVIMHDWFAEHPRWTDGLH